MTLRKTTNMIMLILCGLGAALAITVLGLVLFFLLSKGFRFLHPTLFTRLPNHMDEQAGGMSQAVFGTLTLMGLASLLGLPLGVLGGIYQLEARGRFASTVRFFTDVLNGIPSIVIGIFVYAAIVYPTAKAHPGTGFSAYAGGFALGILMIPTVMRTTEEILRLVPNALREASLGLGATRWRTMWSIVLPAAARRRHHGHHAGARPHRGRDGPAAVHHSRQRVLRDPQTQHRRPYTRPCRPWMRPSTPCRCASTTTPRASTRTRTTWPGPPPSS